MDTGMHSEDSESGGSSSAAGSCLLDFQLADGAFDSNDFAQFSNGDFPNLHAEITDDIKLEPISPLAQSPQPLSPYGNGSFSTFLEVKSETQVLYYLTYIRFHLFIFFSSEQRQLLDTPPISPPQLTPVNPSYTPPKSPPALTPADVIKVITLDASGKCLKRQKIVARII